MIPRVLTILLAVAVLGGSGSARTFTNTEGKTIEAEIVRATAKSVTLLLPNRRSTTIPLTTLSEEDRTHVAEWLAARIPSLRFTPNLKRSNKNKRLGSSSTRSSYQQVQTYEMSVDVRNEENTKGLEDSVMKYVLVGRSLTDNNRFKILAVQEGDFSVPVSGRTHIPFRTVVNEYYDSSISNSRSGFKCIGYILHAERKGDKREVYSHGSTNQLKEHIHAIVKLRAGDLTDGTFVKPDAPVRPGAPAPDPDAPIIVR